MKYDSVLDQQSISGKIVSLILCVWKPCYVKSGHIYFNLVTLITVYIHKAKGKIQKNCTVHVYVMYGCGLFLNKID